MKWTQTLLRMLILILASEASATSLSAIGANNSGVKALQNKQDYKAYQDFVDAAAEDSFDPVIRLNLGVTYLANKEVDKAIAEFKLAEQMAAPGSDAQFMARFNLGVVYAAQSQIEAALSAYQAALDIKPDSKEAKTNIELLWQQSQGQGAGKNPTQQQNGQNNDGDGGQSDKQEEKKGEQGPGDDPKEQKKDPKPFSSDQLTPETVQKIMEEMKQQEQRVRAEHYSKGTKEKARDKEW